MSKIRHLLKQKKARLALLCVALMALPVYALAGDGEPMVQHAKVQQATAQHAKQEVEIKGVVQSLPAKKMGLWTIQGTAVKVTPQTRIDEEECVLKKGGLAEAEGTFLAKVLVARKLECEGPEDKDDDKHDDHDDKHEDHDD